VTLLINAIRVAFVAIARNTLRSSLTVLGILIGVMAVVTVVALAEGANDKVGGELEGMAANAIYVYPQSTQQSGARGKTNGRLTEADGKAIAREAVSVADVGYFLSTQAQVIRGDKNVQTWLMGNNLGYFPVRKWEVAQGALWTETDELLKTKVCILGETVRQKLFEPDEDPIGGTIRIAGFPFRVIGVLKARGASTFGDDQDDRVVITTGSYRARVQHTSPGRLDELIVGATSSETVDRAVEQIGSILRQRHRIAQGRPDDFVVHTQQEQRQVQEQIFGVLGMLLFGVAAISLLVGGIGVMNIMLVSVAERTREIGIRMSMGARESDILMQFLIEAVVLSCIGGVTGMLLGVVVTSVVGRAFDLPLHASPAAIVVAIGTSAAIGLVFGFLPARRAAKLDPIDALRTE
jgi:putative ABC transport system permease protein